MYGKAEVSCLQNVKIQAAESLPEKKRYGRHTGHSAHTHPFIREAISKNYEP